MLPNRASWLRDSSERRGRRACRSIVWSRSILHRSLTPGKEFRSLRVRASESRPLTKSPSRSGATGVLARLSYWAGQDVELLHEDRNEGVVNSPEQPSRRDQSCPRRGLAATPDPENKYEPWLGFRGCKSYDRRGVAPSPALRPEAESGIRRSATETQRGQRVWRTLTSDGHAHKYARKGRQICLRTNVAPRVTPVRANYSLEAVTVRQRADAPDGEQGHVREPVRRGDLGVSVTGGTLGGTRDRARRASDAGLRGWRRRRCT